MIFNRLVISILGFGGGKDHNNYDTHHQFTNIIKDNPYFSTLVKIYAIHVMLVSMTFVKTEQKMSLNCTSLAKKSPEKFYHCSCRMSPASMGHLLSYLQQAHRRPVGTVGLAFSLHIQAASLFKGFNQFNNLSAKAKE